MYDGPKTKDPLLLSCTSLHKSEWGNEEIEKRSKCGLNPSLQFQCTEAIQGPPACFLVQIRTVSGSLQFVLGFPQTLAGSGKHRLVRVQHSEVQPCCKHTLKISRAGVNRNSAELCVK